YLLFVLVYFTEKLYVYNLDATHFIRGPVAKDLGQKITCIDADAEMPSGAHIMMNLPAYAVNFLPAFSWDASGTLLFRKGAQISSEGLLLLVCEAQTAHEDVPDKWYVDRAEEMVREFVKAEEASIDLIHHVRTVSSRKEMFCVQLNLNWNFLTKASENAQKRSCEDNDSTEVESKKKKLD
ncbi:hypothetical protein OESDEN_17722, partial [Oesophagostomum dentatum]